MKYDEEKEEFILENGSSILDDDNSLKISTIEAIVVFEEHVGTILEFEARELTPEERQEIAEYMIELWRDWSK